MFVCRGTTAHQVNLTKFDNINRSIFHLVSMMLNKPFLTYQSPSLREISPGSINLNLYSTIISVIKAFALDKVTTEHFLALIKLSTEGSPGFLITTTSVQISGTLSLS